MHHVSRRKVLFPRRGRGTPTGDPTAGDERAVWPGSIWALVVMGVGSARYSQCRSETEQLTHFGRRSSHWPESAALS